MVDQGDQTSVSKHTTQLKIWVFGAVVFLWRTKPLLCIMYLVWPHEAYEENDGESNNKDIETPEPGTLEGGQNEGLYHARLERT